MTTAGAGSRNEPEIPRDPFVEQLLAYLEVSGPQSLRKEIQSETADGSTPIPAVTPVLFDFLESLKTQGFEVGLRQYLRIYRLLSDVRCPPHRLPHFLGPILATSRRQQRIFHDTWHRFFPWMGDYVEPLTLRSVIQPISAAAPSAPTPTGDRPFSQHEVDTLAQSYSGGARSDPKVGPSKPSGKPGFARRRRVLASLVGIVLVGGLGWAAWAALWPQPVTQIWVAGEVQGSAGALVRLEGSASAAELLVAYLPGGRDDTSDFEFGLTPATWSSSDENVVAVEPTPDGGATLRFQGPGVARVSATATNPELEGADAGSVTVTVKLPPTGFDMEGPASFVTGEAGSAVVGLHDTLGQPLIGSDMGDSLLGYSVSPAGVVSEESVLVGTAAIGSAFRFGDRLSPGQYWLKATLLELRDSVPFEVRPLPIVTTIRVDDINSLMVGEEQRLDVLLIENGAILSGVAATAAEGRMAWTSSNARTAVVDAEGRVRGLTPGRATLRASVDGLNAYANVDVIEAPVIGALLASVPGFSLVQDERGQFDLMVIGPDGTELDRLLAPPRIDWSSSDEDVVRLEPGGLGTGLIAVAPGRAFVRFTALGRMDSAEVVVARPPWFQPERAAWYWPALLGPASTLFLLGLMMLGLRGILVLRRERPKVPLTFWPLKVHNNVSPYAATSDFSRATLTLRQRQLADSRRVDVPATIHATVEAGGYPDFRFSADTRPPEYLMLIDSRSTVDHQSRLFHHLAGRLRDNGVYVTEYFFEDDPRVCMSVADNSWALLTELRRRHPTYRLLMVTSGDRLLHPSTGELHGWAKDFASWDERAVLTPAAPAQWGFREVMLSEHFPVLPATIEGITAAADHFDTHSRPSLADWKGRSKERPTPEVRGPEDLEQLREYLGDDAYRWMCALAIYPELHWDLTLHLGGLSDLGDGLVVEENLIRLIRLPWFRDGSIPPDIATALREALEPETRDAVRKAIKEVLQENPPPEGTVASDRFRLLVAVQEVSIDPSNVDARRELRDALEDGAGSFIDDDFTVLREMQRSAKSKGLDLGRDLDDGIRRRALREKRRAPMWLRAALAALIVVNLAAFLAYRGGLTGHLGEVVEAVRGHPVQFVAQSFFQVDGLARDAQDPSSVLLRVGAEFRRIDLAELEGSGPTDVTPLGGLTIRTAEASEAVSDPAALGALNSMDAISAVFGAVADPLTIRQQVSRGVSRGDGSFPDAHAFQIDEGFGASGWSDGMVRVWRLDPPGAPLELRRLGGAVTDLLFLDQRRLIIARDDGSLFLWRLPQ